MIPEIITLWEENKHKLVEYFRKTDLNKYSSSYSDIVKKLFELVINTDDVNYNFQKLRVLNDGYYEGTLIFIAVKNTCQPSVEDYLITNTYYGSCSACDTLQSISEYGEGLPNEKQVKEFMTLALHLVQKMKRL